MADRVTKAADAIVANSASETASVPAAASPAATLIVVRGVSKLFGRRARNALASAPSGDARAGWLRKKKLALAIDDVSFDIPGGAVTMIAGPAGSGKSTLLGLLNRLVDPTAGQIIVDGEDICALSARRMRQLRRETFSTAFQSGGLIPHMTVFDNILYPLQVRGPLSKGARQRAREWMAAFGVAKLEDTYPGEIGLADRIRVGLVRALVADRPVILLDEPFALLAPAVRHDMRRLVLGHAADTRKTLVITTGDVNEALELGSRVVMLRDGRVEQAGSPADILLRPASDQVSAWTLDANRAALITVRQVMEPLEQKTHARGPAVQAGASLAEAARVMTEAGANFAHVNGPDGEPVAALTLSKVVSAMQAMRAEAKAPGGTTS